MAPTDATPAPALDAPVAPAERAAPPGAPAAPAERVASLGAPVAPEERLVSLDVLRGFALLGIVLINVAIFANGFWGRGPAQQRYPDWPNQAAMFVSRVFVAGKANALFSFLFGLGFTLQLRRVGEGRSRGTAVFLRRLAVLFAFGMAHAVLIWSGDVLHHYAVLGLALLALRNVPRRWLFALIVVVFLAPQAARAYRAATVTPAEKAAEEAFMADMGARSREAYAGSAYGPAVQMRLRDIAAHDGARPADAFDWLMTLSLTTLLGLHFGRERLIERAAEKAAFWARLQKWSLLIGLGAALVQVALTRGARPGPPTPLRVFTGFLFDLSRPALMLFYVSTVVRFYLRRPQAPWLDAIAAAGRMPLTNYVMQSVLCTFVFYGFGLGLYGKASPLACYGIATAAWAVEVVWSRLWLRRFAFGPGEWLWRVLTYGRLLPIRRSVRAAASGAEAG
jgi:uncharacterized protein